MNELRARSLHSADTLAARSGESVWIGTAHEGGRSSSTTCSAPTRAPRSCGWAAICRSHASGVGKTLLAFDHGLRRPRGPAPRFTDRTLTESSALAAELYEIRQRGWAASVDERTEGESAIGAPIRDGSGRVVGAVSIAGRTDRLTEAGLPRAALAAQVTDAARDISSALLH
ncbi:IclR family transcriptional regulator C-terminal domain-containing protein [Streptomyces sp. KL116D]|uniref:IclR family transcriptional regulator domain-containing protein n=1 Tax=Streptomyces sp. KL116D TaxID=3045152 RepID=UPI003556487B